MDTDKPTPTKTASSGWTPAQGYVMAVACLLIGIAVGYLWRGSATREPAGPSVAVPTIPQTAPQMPPQSPMGTQITPEQLKGMADKQAEPMLERLKAEPNNADLLASIGNAYYDAQQFSDAVNYYGRALKLQPANTAVRTDMGTAYWYLGDADKAIREFQTVLKAEPTKANALFNLGVVEWRGKMDAHAAIAAWQKLLDSNPTYENRSQVQQMIAEAKKHADMKPGTKTDKPAM